MVNDNRIKRQRTDRGTTYTFPDGTKISFSDVSKSALHEALEKLYTLEQAMDEGRLIMIPRKICTPPAAEIIHVMPKDLYDEEGESI